MTHLDLNPLHTPLQNLLSVVADYLRPREPWLDVAEVIGHAVIYRVGDGLPPMAVGLPSELRSELQIELQTRRATQVARSTANDISVAPVLTAIAAAAPQLRWRQNPTYTDAVFLQRYAYCELVGPAGHAVCSSFSAGLLYLAAGTFYPPHAHPAEEVYHLLCGESCWQQGDQPARWLTSGARVLHPGGVAHSMQSGPQPMLALYVWRGDLETAARLT